MHSVALVCITIAAIAMAATWPRVSRWILRLRLAAAIERVRVLAKDPAHFHARITPARESTSRRESTARVYTNTAALVELGQRIGGDDASRAEGTAYFVSGAYQRAAAAFGRIRKRTAHDWNDLAAAAICAADATGEPAYWLQALEATDEALAREPSLPEARFNRARVLDGIGISPAARPHWKWYVVHAHNDDGWTGVARKHLAAPEADRARWAEAAKDFSKLSRAELEKLTKAIPQEARSHAEGVLPVKWALALLEGHGAEAERHLEQARTIAEVLRTTNAEPLPRAALAAIDSAGHTGGVKELAQGYSAYNDGRKALSENRVADAEPNLRRAYRAFAAAGSPMTGVADFYAAVAMRNANRTVDAVRTLDRLLMAEKRAATPSPSLIARIHHEIALCEASRGHWSDSLAAARIAMSTFSSLRERGNAAAAEAILSEDYDFLGQRDLAWKHGVAAVRNSSAAGYPDRVRVILGALSRTELRGRRWREARALIRLEHEVAPLAPNPQYDAGAFLRSAIAAWHLSEPAVAERSLSRARAAAGRIPRGGGGEKLAAEIDAVAGAIARRSDIGRGIRLLSAAIDFEKRTERPILLPELYLERGRAHLASNDIQSAKSDFDRGIEELERQRTHVTDTLFRPGIFADAAELFDEAVGVQLRLGKPPEAVLAYVERGRARAVVEEMELDGTGGTWTPPRVADIQRELAPGSVLLEYAALPEALVAFMISRDVVLMRTVATSRAQLNERAAEFVEATASRRDADGTALHDLLFAPFGLELQRIRSITIVPDDVLQRVPFAALSDRKAGTYMAERYTIATTPSAKVFVATAQRLRERRFDTSTGALVFANPAVDRELFPSLVPLRAAEREAEWVARRHSTRAVFIGAAATADRFLRIGPSSDPIHFAGHAVIRGSEAGGSALLCAASDDRSGILAVRDITRMRFTATRTVVLARAARSAAGTRRSKVSPASPVHSSLLASPRSSERVGTSKIAKQPA
ncbi:MAG TPA: CHAT domain-containing protein [Thermoanaerobaculia bacterium]